MSVTQIDCFLRLSFSDWENLHSIYALFYFSALHLRNILIRIKRVVIITTIFIILSFWAPIYWQFYTTKKCLKICIISPEGLLHWAPSASSTAYVIIYHPNIYFRLVAERSRDFIAKWPGWPYQRQWIMCAVLYCIHNTHISYIL